MPIPIGRGGGGYQLGKGIVTRGLLWKLLVRALVVEGGDVYTSMSTAQHTV